VRVGSKENELEPERARERAIVVGREKSVRCYVCMIRLPCVIEVCGSVLRCVAVKMTMFLRVLY